MPWDISILDIFRRKFLNVSIFVGYTQKSPLDFGDAKAQRVIFAVILISPPILEMPINVS